MSEPTTSLLLDFSNIAYATYYAMTGYHNSDLETEQEKIDYWKFLMLQSIRKVKCKHRPDELVVCVDSRSWRKKAFPYYKAKRDQLRRESGMDFQFFIENMEEFISDLSKTFPYKVIKLNGAEADDLIAVLSDHLSKVRKKVVIASNDKDFRQLVKKNVLLWSMRDEKFVNVDDPQEFLVCHVLGGDTGDGIPNVRSDDDTFIVDGKRQKPCGDKMIAKILEEGLDKWLEREGLTRNWNRNRKLIALDRMSIPPGLWNKAVEVYAQSEPPTPNFTKILHYFARHRMRNLMPEVKSFM